MALNARCDAQIQPPGWCKAQTCKGAGRGRHGYAPSREVVVRIADNKALSIENPARGSAPNLQGSAESNAELKAV